MPYFAGPDPFEPEAGQEVTFSTGFIPGGVGSRVTGAAWDFGDGNTATGIVVTHTYTTPGEYIWSAVVSDTFGGTQYFPDNPITVTEPSVTYTASFTVTADIGYAPFRPTFTSTSTPTPETFEWTGYGNPDGTSSSWSPEFYDEYPNMPVTLRCTWNGGATVRETTQYLDVLATPRPMFSVGPVVGFAPFTATVTDLSGPPSLFEYGATGWAYTMNTDGPSVFTQDGEFEYLPGLTGDFATSAKITYPLPLPLELQFNALTPNVAYVTGPTVTVLGPQNRPDAVIETDENTIFLPVKKVSDEEFASIRMRGVTNALPTTVLDNGGYPDRQLYFWPIPNDSSKAIELWIWEPLVILDLDAELNLPPGYERYYTYALAMELCDTFGKRPTREIVASLAEAESAIKVLNQLDFRVAPSTGALELSKRSRAYNIIDFKSGANMLPRSDQ